MTKMSSKDRLMFLSWESPWPSFSGGALRTMGLLKQLSNRYNVDLLVFSKDPLAENQERELGKHAASIRRYRLRNAGIVDLLVNLSLMLLRRCPYHCAVAFHSVMSDREAREKLREPNKAIYASYGHWGTLALNNRGNRWILDQHNADIHFWIVYSSQASNIFLKILARINGFFARLHYPQVYRHAHKIVSVCDEDKALTSVYCAAEKVCVIENGVDCSYLVPSSNVRKTANRVLFTGTSAPRNITALREFVENVFPIIYAEMPNVRLVVGGNFSSRAQAEFKHLPWLEFTGKVDDMRPVFDSCDIFVAPFKETHGSKLKIAEAMARGMCIVATPEGIRGFQLVHGESVVISESDRGFAAAVITLLREPKHRTRIGHNAHNVALATIDWDVLGARLHSMTDAVLHDDKQQLSSVTPRQLMGCI